MKFLIPGKDFEVAKDKKTDTTQLIDRLHGINYTTAQEAIIAIYKGTFYHSCYLPVLPEFQSILGTNVLICADATKATEKRKIKAELVFTVEEFKLIVQTFSEHGKEGVRAMLKAKQLFRGVIGAV